MATDAFWKHKENLRGYVNLQTKKRLLNCYVSPVARYKKVEWTIHDITVWNEVRSAVVNKPVGVDVSCNKGRLYSLFRMINIRRSYRSQSIPKIFHNVFN